MQISSLISVACPSFFINNGSRNNRGIKLEDENFERRGVFVAMVGARFERKEVMESQHILISKNQNKEENGYGSKRDENKKSSKKNKIWENFYGVECFPTYEEAIILSKYAENQIVSGKDYFFNVKVYKERLRMSIEPYFLYCNEYSRSINKKAHVRMVGLGLGVWYKIIKNYFQIQYCMNKKVV